MESTLDDREARPNLFCVTDRNYVFIYEFQCILYLYVCILIFYQSIWQIFGRMKWNLEVGTIGYIL